MQCGGPYWLPPRRAPFGRRAGQPSEGAPTDTARSPRASEAARPHLLAAGRRVHDSRPQLEPEHRVLRSFPPSGTHRDGSAPGSGAADGGGGGVREGLSGQRGTDRYGWYACPWRTLFATEWSAARKNPMRAVALHLSAAISADDKARRILTSGRRERKWGRAPIPRSAGKWGQTSTLSLLVPRRRMRSDPICYGIGARPHFLS